jgi:iron complex transport system permease protein
MLVDRPVRSAPMPYAARLAPWRRPTAAVVVSATLAVLVGLLALTVGRYSVPLGHVVAVLWDQVTGRPWAGSATERDVVVLVRVPRVIIAMLVGGAFVSGLLALAVVFLVTAGRGGASVLMIVLGGVVTGSFFAALVSLVTYLADPYTSLPSIVFWLLGSVATATFDKVLVALGPIVVGAVVIVLLRWRLNVLSLGDEDAKAVGMRPGPVRWTVLCAVTLTVAGAVAVSGVIGWVGLVVPHLTRMWVGPDHRVLLPTSCFVGAAFLVGVDTLARSVTASEIPLGVLTALIGAPAFFVLLRRHRDRVWDRP